eukprot:Phypoly_transcript_17399.p1 GENE.Phypoly_transcript_17399~~Phypoly_transcript_17399.p1  ORF type:complete len:248 (+),score=37.40 Phypoly_transcript_17399:40-744(+)
MKTIVVFDFDWTLINCNSDTYIIEQLRPDIYKQMETIRKQNNFGWTQLMDHMMGLLHENQITKDEITKCLSGILLDPSMVKSLELLASKGDDVEVHIVSDANQVFIETILQSNKIAHHFKSVVTNGAKYDENGRLRVTPYHTQVEPHTCKLCPPNLCKGSCILLHPQDARMIYLGDGAGDFCPLQHIKNGHVLARKGWALNKLLDKNAEHTKASIHLWENADDVLRILQEILPE